MFAIVFHIVKVCMDGRMRANREDNAPMVPFEIDICVLKCSISSKQVHAIDAKKKRYIVYIVYSYMCYKLQDERG